MSGDVINILFVCTGNICRSPTAHAVMKKLVTEQQLADRIFVDSAGVSGYHVGQRPDPRSQSVAKTRGYDLSTLRARKVSEKDFEQFHYLIAMDRGHLAHLTQQTAKATEARFSLLMHFAPVLGKDDVVDPYYGPSNGFERVLDDIEAGCQGLLEFLRRQHGI